ncbi:MAG: NAD(P)-dependent oxidoreductase [Candidatus Shapirobacteria bacterium]|jgi:GDP-L-fucose synthase
MNKIETIFLTGGTGFIGRNFVECFKDKYKILSPSHKELDLLDTVAVDNFFKKNKIDVVIHTANIGGLRNSMVLNDSIKNNLKMFFNIVKNKNYFKKMIHFGSGAEYGKSKDIINVKESDFGLNIPSDDYGFYKYVCSKYIENSTNIYCLRIFGVFGKYEDFTIKFISNLLCKYIYKMPLTLIRDCKFDYVYIDDFMKIIEYFIKNDLKEKFFNVGSGNKYSLLELAKEINKLDNYSLPIIVKQNGLNKEYTSNNDLLKKEIKNLKLTKIEVAIKDLYRYYLSNKSIINPNLLIKNE